MIESACFSSSATVKRLCFTALLAGTGAALVGCGAGTVSHTSSGTFAIRGQVHGGQQPVANSVIKLYAVGQDGNASSSMLSRNVTTAADGTFDLGGHYTCGSDSDQVYLVALGGNPGLTPAVDNPALVMMTAFGSCGNLATATYLEINEVTTVAAAWALAPFITSYANIGSTSSNTNGIASAFLNAQLLADSATGMVATLPSNLAIEQDKLYALADALAPCVNSDGGTGCIPLFLAATPTNGTAPLNTLQAALNIVRNPGENVGLVFGALDSEAPFPTKFKAAPHDWTMSLTVSGEGMNSPTQLAVDGFNNVWVASYTGLLSVFNAQGTPLSATGYGAGELNEVYGLAVDFNNNIWLTNEQEPHHHPTQGSVTAFLGAGSSSMGSYLTGTPYIYDASIYFPFAVAADTNGDILIANNSSSAITIYNDAGQFVESGVGAAYLSGPVAVAPDSTHGLWVAGNEDNVVTHLDSTGALIATSDCCDGPNAVATDKFGNVWVANFAGDSLTELASNGSVKVPGATGGGVDGNAPSGLSLDASQNVWVANYYGGNISEIAGSGGTLAAGTAISPSYGYGLDAKLLLPYTIVPDAGGNLWVSNFGNDTLTMFFGLATPTKTPLLPTPTAP